MRWLAALALIACSRSAEPPPAAPPPAAPPVAHDAGVDAASTPCPAAYGAPGACYPDDPHAVCRYPEGTCECVQPCRGGAVPPPPRPGVKQPNPFRWLCTPTPPAARADGCPGVAPTAGTPCKVKVPCHYGLENNGPCVGSTYRCEGGAWTPPVPDQPPP